MHEFDWTWIWICDSFTLYIYTHTQLCYHKQHNKWLTKNISTSKWNRIQIGKERTSVTKLIKIYKWCYTHPIQWDPWYTWYIKSDNINMNFHNECDCNSNCEKNSFTFSFLFCLCLYLFLSFFFVLLFIYIIVVLTRTTTQLITRTTKFSLLLLL